MSGVFGANRLDELVRRMSGLTMDSNDLDRLTEFVNGKLYDLLLIGVQNASHNNRDLVVERDLPLTRGLRESMKDFVLYEEKLDIESILEQLATRPLLEREPSQQVVDLLPDLFGTLMMVTLELMPIVDPGVANPDDETWERVTATMDLLI
jgi:hypothetical protein